MPRGAPANSPSSSCASRGLGTCQGVAAIGRASSDSGPFGQRQQGLQRRPTGVQDAGTPGPGAPPGRLAAAPSPLHPAPSGAGRTPAATLPPGPPGEPARARAQTRSRPGSCWPRGSGRPASPPSRRSSGSRAERWGSRLPRARRLSGSGQSEAPIRRPERRESVARTGSESQGDTGVQGYPLEAGLAGQTHDSVWPELFGRAEPTGDEDHGRQDSRQG